MTISNDVFNVEGFKNGAVKVLAGEAIPLEFVSCDKPEFDGCFFAEVKMYFRYVAGVLVCMLPEDCDTSIFVLKSDTPVVGGKFKFAPNGIGPMVVISVNDFSTLLKKITDNLSPTKKWHTSITEDNRGNIVEYSY